MKTTRTNTPRRGRPPIGNVFERRAAHILRSNFFRLDTVRVWWLPEAAHKDGGRLTYRDARGVYSHPPPCLPDDAVLIGTYNAASTGKEFVADLRAAQAAMPPRDDTVLNPSCRAVGAVARIGASI